MKSLLGSRTTLAMYRDCLKAVPLMNADQFAQDNVKLHFRRSFETQRAVTSEAEHVEFRAGIIRFLSNLVAHDVMRQYKENPEKYENGTIYDEDSDGESERQPEPVKSESRQRVEALKKKKEEEGVEVDAANLPFF